MTENSQLHKRIIAMAVKHLPALEGVPVNQLRALRVVRTYSDGEYPHQRRHHVVAFVGHPEYGDEEVQGYVTVNRGSVVANWGYGVHEVNGVAYSSRTKANRVRKALADAGIPHVYPGCREGVAAQRTAGITE